MRELFFVPSRLINVADAKPKTEKIFLLVCVILPIDVIGKTNYVS